MATPTPASDPLLHDCPVLGERRPVRHRHERPGLPGPGALILGAGFLACAIVLLRGATERAPIATFKYSIVYLAALCGVLLVDHYLPV